MKPLHAITSSMQIPDSVGRPAAEAITSDIEPRPKDFARWSCGSPDHPIRFCPKTPEERRRSTKGNNTSSQVRSIQKKRNRTCITVRYKKRRLDALVDTAVCVPTIDISQLVSTNASIRRFLYRNVMHVLFRFNPLESSVLRANSSQSS